MKKIRKIRILDLWNTAFGSGRVRHSVTTVAACQQECRSTVNCNGFDFNPANQCCLTGPWAWQYGKYTRSPGVTRYTVENVCVRTYNSHIFA